MLSLTPHYEGCLHEREGAIFLWDTLVDSLHIYSPSLPLTVKGEFCIVTKAFCEREIVFETKRDTA